MKKTLLMSCMLSVQLVLSAGSARAEDIDIFGQLPTTGVNPNVMILIDNASSNNASFASTCSAPGWSTGKLMDAVTCALYLAVQQIGTQTSLQNRLNIGLMDYGIGSNQGGQWVSPSSAPTALPTMDTTGINNFLTNVANLNQVNGTSNSRAAPSVFQETWAFFTGGTGLSGTNYSNKITVSCQKSFIIFIGAAAKQGQPAVGIGNVDLSTTTATAAQKIQISTSNLGAATGDDGAWTDEWARYLYQTDFSNQGGSQNIVTYTIAATGGNPEANYVQHLTSMAKQGGGKAFVGDDVASMVQALLQIFNEIQAVNSAFASASLPVSVNTQGTYLNQVYIGMFRPDANANPRWVGNLKQYQFGVDLTVPTSPTLYLADSTGTRALNSAGTGFIAPTAVSFWTKAKNLGTYPDSLGGFWVNNPQGSGGGFDTPDGEIVEKGAAAQQTRVANLLDNYSATAGSATNPRNLYTCTSGSGLCAAGASLSASPFATSNASLTQTALGLTTSVSNSVSTLNRKVTTAGSTSSNAGTSTFVLTAAPTTPLTNGQSVTISGASDSQMNGTKAITLVNSTTFTIPVIEYPPLTSTGSYTASIPASGVFSVTSMTRSGTTVTVNAPGHTFVNGEQITISGATGTSTLYNGLKTLSGTVVAGASFQFTIAYAPATPGTVLSSVNQTCTNSGSNTFNISSITRLPTGTGLASGLNAEVQVTTVANLTGKCNLIGSTLTITGVTDTLSSPSLYNTTTATIVKLGNNCTGIGGNPGNILCYLISTNPPSPATGSITAQRAAAVATIATMTHPASTCNGTTGSASVLVTATTVAPHGFVSTDQVTISGTPGVNEANTYTTQNSSGLTPGKYNISNVTASTFQFTLPLTNPTPLSGAGCQFSNSGVTVSTSTTGIPAATLINWVRGEDDLLKDELSPDTTYTNVNIRPSLHGDVLHSRPAIVNYGSNKIVAFYGVNDGPFRAVNANQTGNIGTTVPGGELWSFIPTDFFSKLSRLYANSPSILLKSTPTGIVPTPTQKDYFFDGNIGVYQDTSSNNTNACKVCIYLTSRRGGRVIYALDVTDPEVPKFMWKKSSADYPELGYTWSDPKVALVKGNANPVVIMGAGYDIADDSEPPGTFTMGRGIFILDAFDGSLVWQAKSGGGTDTCTGASGSTACQLQTMTYPIPADVALIDRNYDGKFDRAYAADTGGNIWRIDFSKTGSSCTTGCASDWSVTKFAALGGAAGDTTKRKFLFPPDVIATKDFDAVLASTGDREHPLKANTVTFGIVNRFYMMKDPNNGIGSNAANPPVGWTPITDSQSSTSTNPPASGIGLFDCTGCIANPITATYNLSGKGFAIILPNTGEKGVNKSNSIGGFTYFGTNTPVDPTAGTCATGLGIARGYKVNAFTGATTSTIFDGGGLPPSPVVGLVTVTFPGATSPTTVPFLIGGGIPGGTSADSRSAFGGQIPPIVLTGKRYRKYWDTEHDK